jgi:adenine-specific DNA methylase
MKYMGSKRAMLSNGLGKMIAKEIQGKDRFVDLFAGSAAVSWFVASNFEVSVLSVDLQHYSKALANSVLLRTNDLDEHTLDMAYQSWVSDVQDTLTQDNRYQRAVGLMCGDSSVEKIADQSIALCESEPGGIIWKSYGGYYFSPAQARIIDSLNQSIPADEPYYSFFKSLLVIVASQIVAAPGHTAQPFKANETAGKFLMEAWTRDTYAYLLKAYQSLRQKRARNLGCAIVSDANEVARSTNSQDLVFLDPPYSGVHYSRFYHVLETIAKGYCGPVQGTGRYPDPSERPVSSYSRKGEVKHRFDELMQVLSSKGSSVIMTYPDGNCSNGLSGEDVLNISGKYFSIDQKVIKSRFSTMGGNNETRSARKNVNEMVLLLRSN